ncbi:MAG: terpene cyclase/mutase family protein [Spirochaetaceae bacterium]|nr:terpene cyclase/mutase family protein [Spirochaetaceae bacterium]
MSDTSPLRRHFLVGATVLLTPLLVLTTPGVADAAPTRDRADAAAGWLGRQLDADTDVVQGQFGPDYGLTADVVLALDAAGVGRTTARQATAALRRNVLAYTGGGDPTEFYAGSFAKLIVVAEAQGVPARQFGRSARSNLVVSLRSLECGTPRRTDCAEVDLGRFSDRSQFGDFSNAITQSLALIGLDRATAAGPSTASVRYLRTQQCDNGSFPLTFGATDCVASVDATGFAVQALASVGSRPARVAAQEAGQWLRRQQNDDGSLSGNGSRNANSTALAAQGFDALGLSRPGDRARGFLRSLQVRCGGPAARRGSVRYDASGSGDALRATSQAVPALAMVTLDDITSEGARRGLPTLAC